MARVRLETTDLAGQPIQTIAEGQDFLLRAFADDLREGETFPGVFGVYADVWYRPELIGVDAGLTRDSVDFDKLFRNGKSVDASLPGVFSEIGAFSSSQQGAGEQEVALWSVKVRALQPGLAQFVLDEADQAGRDVLLFGMNTAVDLSQVDFVNTVVQITAADGSIPTENDFPVTVPEEIAILPPTNFDPNPTITPCEPTSPTHVAPPLEAQPPSELPPTLQTPPVIDETPLVRIRLAATDLAGRPIETVIDGEEFVLRAYAEDLRSGQAAAGVFAAYVDVWYRSELIDIPSGTAPDTATFNEPFVDGRTGDTAIAGIINDIGSFAGQQTPTGAGEVLVWSIKVKAKQPGLAHFVLDDADVQGRDVLLYGLDEAVDFSRVELVDVDVQITRLDGSLPEENDLPVNIVEIESGRWVSDAPSNQIPQMTVLYDGTGSESGTQVDIPVTGERLSVDYDGMALAVGNVATYSLDTRHSETRNSESVNIQFLGNRSAVTNLPITFPAPPSQSVGMSAGRRDEADSPRSAELAADDRPTQSDAHAAAVDSLMEFSTAGVPHRIDIESSSEDEIELFE